jgi:hypothetical protein
MASDWLTTKEAAALLGYSVNYFRKEFCNPQAPLVTIREVGQPGMKRRRILVSRASIERMIEEQTIRPQGY